MGKPSFRTSLIILCAVLALIVSSISIVNVVYHWRMYLQEKQALSIEIAQWKYQRSQAISSLRKLMDDTKALRLGKNATIQDRYKNVKKFIEELNLIFHALEMREIDQETAESLCRIAALRESDAIGVLETTGVDKKIYKILDSEL